MAYMPFGETLISQKNTSFAVPYLFTSKELDAETGLYYFGARYYDPNEGRWWGVDPLAEMYPNVSSYVYCANNPVKYIDPDGRWIKLTEAVKYTPRGTVETKNGISKELRGALKDDFSTPEGLAFFAQYAKKGDRIAGHTFTEDGVLSDKTFNIIDYSFSEETGYKTPSSENGSISIDPETGTVTMKINTYQLDSKEDIVEVVAHETLVHGSKSKAKLAGQKTNSGEQDHKALRDKSMKHSGYKLYKSVRSQLEKVSNKYKSVFKDAENTYKENYKDIK